MLQLLLYVFEVRECLTLNAFSFRSSIVRSCKVRDGHTRHFHNELVCAGDSRTACPGSAKGEFRPGYDSVVRHDVLL